MSRKHPQNGPSFSKAPHKKHKPLDEKELAALQARRKSGDDALASRVDEAQRKIAGGKRFKAAVVENGGVIPIRGGNAPEFWSEIRRADEEAAATAKTKPPPQVDSEGRTIIAYDGADRIGKTSVIAREKDETDEQYRTRSAALKQLMAKPRPPGRRI
ncbi:hypothetical protein [Bradyrhizobium yuanmingense]|uniref:hypothetical protein n=1 Tax=Bradyrhizobium yuanmingense TaxID=108015 RepID=UPI001CD2BE9C|nr:hypothetical protein [Bradyrhizobium yuanmingense]MCA1530866.1 hypothetical protein [Bradyrhizobium yuanmingense]